MKLGSPTLAESSLTDISFFLEVLAAEIVIDFRSDIFEIEVKEFLDSTVIALLDLSTFYSVAKIGNTRPEFFIVFTIDFLEIIEKDFLEPTDFCSIDSKGSCFLILKLPRSLFILGT